jgi:hypothetical protein
MRRVILLVLYLGPMTLGSPAIAAASMIGDTLTITRFYPDLATIYDAPVDAIPGVVVVTATVGPDPGASPQPSHYSIDLEANSISFDFLNSSSFVGMPGPVYSVANPFDGLQFLGFSLDIQNVTVGSAIGITVVELLFGSDFINLNLASAFDAASSLTLNVEFAPTAVPEPGTLALVGIGLALSCVRRRRVSD